MCDVCYGKGEEGGEEEKQGERREEGGRRGEVSRRREESKEGGGGRRGTYQQVCGDENSRGARPELSHNKITILLIHVTMLRHTQRTTGS